VHASVPLSPSEADPLAEVDTMTDPVAVFHGHIESSLDEIASLIQDTLEAADLPLPEGGEA
jgi:hypothetical protein